MTHNTIKIVNNSDINQEKIKALSEKTIFFGHQSVGQNLLDGLETIQAQYSHQIKIKKLDNYKDAEPHTLNHYYVGTNTDPKSKMDEFYQWLNANKDLHIDIAFLKLCYVDINFNSDINDLFEQYKIMIEKIKSIHPETKIVHFTNPLRSYDHDLKNFIKMIINQPRIGIEDNIKRLEYNNLLRKEYSDSASLFDIAKFESTTPQGELKFLKAKNTEFELLLKQYTSDGGHLNENGKQYIAYQFLYFLTKDLQD